MHRALSGPKALPFVFRQFLPRTILRQFQFQSPRGFLLLELDQLPFSLNSKFVNLVVLAEFN